jgi:hypothetical protein
MKTLREIEADVLRAAARVGAAGQTLPTYGSSDDGARPHIELADGLYHYVVVERGVERERRSSERYEDLLYWIFADVTFGMAFSYELANRIEDQDCRRIAFPRQIELMSQLNQEFGRRLEVDIADILRRAPYDDEPIKAVNRMRGTGSKS